MDSSQRFDPLLLDVAPDEELPDYEPATAPEYNGEDFETPLHTYHLRQIERKVQVLVPYGPSASLSYRFVARSSRFFSKKPEIEVLRTSREQPGEETVAGIWFATDGPLPWRPRARFTHPDISLNTYQMESRNFVDWEVAMAGTTYMWKLQARPVSLVLCEKGSALVIARFTYSACGTLATHGAEVGDLTIYRDRISLDADGVEKIMCGLMVVIAHFKSMGRHYRNDGSAGNDIPSRTSSIATENLPSQRTSVSTSSNPNLWAAL